MEWVLHASLLNMNEPSAKTKTGSKQRMDENVRKLEEACMPPAPSNRALCRTSWPCIDTEADGPATTEALICSNVGILRSFLSKIQEKRRACSSDGVLPAPFFPSPEDKQVSFLEEPLDAIMFPSAACGDHYYRVSNDISLSSEVQRELHEYVTAIASLYRDVPFHNFEHASHVTMSANRLLCRLCAKFEDEDVSSVTARTFGLSNDPIAQFAVVFSTLVHDVDHQGVPNVQLVIEADPLAVRYNGRSVAERRSITVAWTLLMEDRFQGLRSLIFADEIEMQRFKELLVDMVLATDISGVDRSAMRKLRWQRAFQQRHSLLEIIGECGGPDAARSQRSLRSAVILEQIMQAADVAHTMQHWDTFKKWNLRLYRELSKGYRDGRGAFDPREGWYEGEIGFFNFYVIPLARKLEECGALGPAAREYLDCALDNRRRWEGEGEQIIEEMAFKDDALAANIP